MNGLFNMNFLMTFLLGKDLPENRDKILMAMTAAQSTNALAPIIAAVGPIKTIAEQAKEIINLKNEIAVLQAGQTDVEACRKELAECQAALKACQDGSALAQCRSDLEACTKKLDACGPVVDKCDEIKRLMRQVSDAGTPDELAKNKDLLAALVALSKQIILSAR